MLFFTGFADQRDLDTIDIGQFSQHLRHQGLKFKVKKVTHYFLLKYINTNRFISFMYLCMDYYLTGNRHGAIAVNFTSKDMCQQGIKTVVFTDAKNSENPLNLSQKFTQLNLTTLRNKSKNLPTFNNMNKSTFDLIFTISAATSLPVLTLPTSPPLILSREIKETPRTIYNLRKGTRKRYDLMVSPEKEQQITKKKGKKKNKKRKRTTTKKKTTTSTALPIINLSTPTNHTPSTTMPTSPIKNITNTQCTIPPPTPSNNKVNNTQQDTKKKKQRTLQNLNITAQNIAGGYKKKRKENKNKF